MIGRIIGDWTIVDVIGEEDELHRYRVEQAGRTATMEIAVAGSRVAAAMAMRSEPRIIARGTDTFGNAYVVLGDAPPPQRIAAPPPAATPPPATPIPRIEAAPRKTNTKLVLTLIGGVVGLIVLINIVRSVTKKGGKSQDAPALAIRVRGSWGYACNAPYTLTVRPDRRGVITVAGKQYPANPSDDVVIELPADTTRPGTTIEVTGEAASGETGRATVKVPERHNHEPLTNGWVGGIATYNIKATLVIDGKPADVRIDKDNDEDKASVIELAFEACGVKPQTSERDGVKVTATADRLRVAIDLKELYWNATTDDKPEATAMLELASGKQAELRIAPKIYRAPDDAFARLANVAKQPLATAPLPSEVTTSPKPIAVLYDGTLSRKLLGAIPVSKAPYVAHVVLKAQRVGSCGPYGYQYLSFTRYRMNATAKLYEARTGKLIGQRSFTGPSPGSCPQTVYAQNNYVPDDFGARPTDAVEAWLASAAR